MQQKNHVLEPLHCPKCHKRLLDERVKEGIVEIRCKRCHFVIRLTVEREGKTLTMRP